MTKTPLRVAKYVFLALAALCSLFPLYFMVVSATNTSADVIGSRLTPGGALMDNISKLTTQQNVGAAMGQSTIYAVSSALLSLLVCSIAGYGFEIYHSKHKDRLMGLLLLTMMIPFAATMIPLFRMFANLNMVSTLPAVVLPTIATPFLILLFRQSARSFPTEIIEAARLDGLSELSIFFRMFLPTMRATYAAAAVITFMAAWNNFLWPKVILVDQTFRTMPMLVASLTSGYVTDYGVLMLAVLLASLPTMFLFLVLQRSFAEGITGAVK
ncbi:MULTISPECIES: carbohydrate ABC transporter permease [Aestuariimicrobium]|uniref:carbohydrate ABC transporter permease n=1 Tax=Aestuariimicrobium TaxID=396388 RepID=UPI0003B54AA4|nr:MULTISPECIES: carbohydrate ABC transporter permease [Aestuariimicrobium]CAI9399893.1 Lactose transport system permease protein LacG [Aestuariimicrobium sp. T2.26MG-19.2B]